MHRAFASWSDNHKVGTSLSTGPATPRPASLRGFGPVPALHALHAPHPSARSASLRTPPHPSSPPCSPLQPSARTPPQDINFVEVTEECKAIGQDYEVNPTLPLPLPYP